MLLVVPPPPPCHLSKWAQNNTPRWCCGSGKPSHFLTPRLRRSACVCVGGGGSADLFQLVSLHVVSQDGAWHVTPLSGENLKKKKKKKTKSSCTSISVTFNLGWNKRNRTWELIFDGAKWRHNELYLRRSNLQSTVWQVLVELWIFRTSDGGSLLWLSSAACADTSKSKGGMILVLSTHQKS